VDVFKAIAVGFFSLTLCTFANCQTSSGKARLCSPAEPSILLPTAAVAASDFDVASAPEPTSNHDANASSSAQNTRHGLIARSVMRGLRDQKELYSAPFKPSNFKWDALLLAGYRSFNSHG
jgi:hypothetical protein